MTSSEPSSASDPIIGIDLGTCFVCASVYKNGRVQRIPNRYGNYLTPNYVAFAKSYGRLVGDDAKEQEIINPRNTFYGIKSCIGEKIPATNPSFAYRSFSKKAGRFPRFLVEMDNKVGKVSKQVLVDAVELLSAVLEAVKQDAEKYLNCRVDKIVLTVPVYFTYFQRCLVCEAGIFAGMDVTNILTEPEAAALAYAFKIPFITRQETKVMILDIGGGGVSTCLASINLDKVKILAVEGKKNCGTQAMLEKVMDRIEKEFYESGQKNLKEDPRSFAILRMACENAIKKLSSLSENLSVPIGQLFEDIDFTASIDRSTFYVLIDDFVLDYFHTLQKCLEHAHLCKDDIDQVIVIGGGSQIPKVRNMLIDFFQKQQVTFEEPLPVSGAALLYHIPRGLKFYRVTPFSLGICMPSNLESNCSDMIFFVKKSEIIPTKQTKTIEMLVNEGSPPYVSLKIYEGENELSQKNHFLGKVMLTNIPIEFIENGERKIELDVTFDINFKNELVVTLLHKQSEKKETLDVTQELEFLRREDVRLVEGMEFNNNRIREENIRREQKLAMNLLKNTCLVLQKRIREPEDYWKERLSQEVQNEIWDKCTEVSIWIEENDSADRTVLEEKLEQVKQLCRDRNAAFLLNR